MCPNLIPPSIIVFSYLNLHCFYSSPRHLIHVPVIVQHHCAPCTVFYYRQLCFHNGWGGSDSKRNYSLTGALFVPDREVRCCSQGEKGGRRFGRVCQVLPWQRLRNLTRRGWRMKGLPEETRISSDMSCKGNYQKTPMFSSFIFPSEKKNKPSQFSKNVCITEMSLAAVTLFHLQAWKKGVGVPTHLLAKPKWWISTLKEATGVDASLKTQAASQDSKTGILHAPFSFWVLLFPFLCNMSFYTICFRSELPGLNWFLWFPTVNVFFLSVIYASLTAQILL